jgi:hypothetical protein
MNRLFNFRRTAKCPRLTSAQLEGLSNAQLRAKRTYATQIMLFFIGLYTALAIVHLYLEQYFMIAIAFSLIPLLQEMNTRRKTINRILANRNSA